MSFITLVLLLVVILTIGNGYMVAPNRKISLRTLSSQVNSELLTEDFFTSPTSASSVQDKETMRKSILSEMFEDIMRKLGKCSKKELRRLITVYDASSLPNDKDDLETHITVALEVLWSSSNGNWTSLVDSVAAELDSTVQKSDANLAKCLEYGDYISEARIKELIRKFSESNNIPKFDKRKYKGKLLKGDFFAELIDLLREKYEGDYEQVANFLAVESQTQKKKGFA